MIYKNKAFTLVEIMIGILIVSAVIIAGFQAYINIGFGKINLVEKSNIQRDSFYFTEKLFQLIKEGGTLDYEEYFNRKVVGTTVLNGHYNSPTGFGNYGKGGIIGTPNYGDGFYYCRSLSPTNYLTNQGCFNNSLSANIDGTPFLASFGDYQRYGQYSFQFIDYNSNHNNDNGDENSSGVITRDDDDEVLGVGPSVFPEGSNVNELYLISGDSTKRTLIRWNIVNDSASPASTTCNPGSVTDFSNINLAGCRGVIEFLKLDGVDWGLNHDLSSVGWAQYDGVVDTWLIDRQFTGGVDIVAGDGDGYRKELFPQTVSVTDFKVYAYPNTSPKDSWKNSSPSSKISPYIVLNFKIKPSWEVRNRLQNEGKEIDFSTTVNLTDIYSN